MNLVNLFPAKLSIHRLPLLGLGGIWGMLLDLYCAALHIILKN